MNLLVLAVQGNNPALLLFGPTFTTAGVSSGAHRALIPIPASSILYALEMVPREDLPPDWALRDTAPRFIAPVALEPIDSEHPAFALGITWATTFFRSI